MVHDPLATLVLQGLCLAPTLTQVKAFPKIKIQTEEVSCSRVRSEPPGPWEGVQGRIWGKVELRGVPNPELEKAGSRDDSSQRSRGGEEKRRQERRERRASVAAAPSCVSPAGRGIWGWRAGNKEGREYVRICRNHQEFQFLKGQKIVKTLTLGNSRG